MHGITFATLTGDNGILNMAINIKEKTEKSQELEEIQLAVTSALIKSDTGFLTIQNIENEFQQCGLNGMLKSSEQWIYVGNKNSYVIEKNGNVYVLNNLIIYGNEENILPDGYQQVEYLESTGTQYIDTEINKTEDFIYKGKAIQTNEGAWKLLFGRQQTTSGYSGGAEFFGHEVKGSTNFGVAFNESYLLCYTVELNEWFEFEYGCFLENGYFRINNEKISINSNIHKCTRNIILFNIEDGGKVNANYAFIGKVKKFEIYDNKETLICQLIPCLDNQNVACMYDIVTQKPFYNAGTGEFLYGPKAYNCVGNENIENKYEIPITLKTLDGDKEIKITLDEPLRKFGDKADYLDLSTKKVIRYIQQDTITGDLSLLDTATEENITIVDVVTNEEISNIDFSRIISVKVNTDVEPSKIE